MVTSSTISVEHQDGTVSTVYCHYDGYLNHNGYILYNYYNSLDMAESLVKLKTLSILGSKLEPHIDKPHLFEGRIDQRQDDVCLAYERDSKDIRIEARKYQDMTAYMNGNNFIEYNYIFMNNMWFYTCWAPADSLTKKWRSLESYFNNDYEINLA